MPKDTHVERKKGDPVKGKTDYDRLKNMTEDEIEENAKSDPDAPLLSDEELSKFKQAEGKYLQALKLFPQDHDILANIVRFFQHTCTEAMTGRKRGSLLRIFDDAVFKFPCFLIITLFMPV